MTAISLEEALERAVEANKAQTEIGLVPHVRRLQERLKQAVPFVTSPRGRPYLFYRDSLAGHILRIAGQFNIPCGLPVSACVAGRLEEGAPLAAIYSVALEEISSEECAPTDVRRLLTNAIARARRRG